MRRPVGAGDGAEQDSSGDYSGCGSGQARGAVEDPVPHGVDDRVSMTEGHQLSPVVVGVLRVKGSEGPVIAEGPRVRVALELRLVLSLDD